MGCTASKWGEVKHDQLNDNLTERQIQLIRDTWDLLSDDMEGTGYIIFNRLFQTEKDLKLLFIRLMSAEQGEALEAACEGGEINMDEYLLKKHAHVVMEALGAAVECLEDSVFLSSVLVALGQIHATYQVRPHYLHRLWPSVRFGLKEVLQDVFTEEVEETWRIVFNYIIGRMRDGIRLEKNQEAATHQNNCQSESSTR